MAPTLTSFAAPTGGARLPWGGPAGGVMAPTLLCMPGIPLRGQATSFAAPTATGGAASLGTALREA